MNQCSGIGSIAAVAAMAATLFWPKMPDPGGPGDEASQIHATHYALIWITHAHAHVFLKVFGVARQQLSLTREPEVKC